MSLQSQLTLLFISFVLGGASYAISRPVFRSLGKKPYIWNGTGLPLGVALGFTYTLGLATLILSLITAGIGGVLGAYLFNKIFPMKASQQPPDNSAGQGNGSLKAEKQEQGYCSVAVGAFIALLLWEWLWPDVMPFKLFQFWTLKGNLIDIVKMSWPVFAWGTGVSFLILLFKGVDYDARENAERNFVTDFILSLWAGVAEEISFRWLIFMSEIIGYKIVNWLLFGWAGFGLFEWFFVHITGPLANFFTLGYLEPILFSGFGWAVGSAILSSNGKFRDGHAYQGLLGFINSWFIGMFMFYLMFTYGLIACIVVHFLYDLFIDIVRYLIAVTARGLTRR